VSVFDIDPAMAKFHPFRTDMGVRAVSTVSEACTPFGVGVTAVIKGCLAAG
jgi:hypothetical protein